MLRIWLIVLVAARASARDSDKRRLLPPEAELREAQAQCTAQQELAPLDHWARRKRLWAFSGRCPQLCEPTPTPISLEFMRAQLAPFAARGPCCGYGSALAPCSPRRYPRRETGSPPPAAAASVRGGPARRENHAKNGRRAKSRAQTGDFSTAPTATIVRGPVPAARAPKK